ncbi:glycoside hydrolase family 88 protein [Maribacter polysiphoniae]|uniref:glycoside hydrolase family 88 protein n=1 Tax=Maribacter polysiphoniae TaxID=429344 RepID=UPI0023546777|nr:glycoside hydrolase family 88 protein [Maribacter polysiphoniae]
MRFIPLFIVLLLSTGSCKTKVSLEDAGIDKNELIANVATQLKSSPLLKITDSISGKKVFPRTVDPSGKLKLVTKRDWTSGFYPGVLWLTYGLTDNKYWKDHATSYTELLESEQFNGSNHDIGFKMMTSYGLGYRYTNKEAYRKVLIQSAQTLITRFDDRVGCIRSWDHHRDKWEYPVIIDNLMNLELLFWAWKETGETVYYNIATTHAKTTMKNHFRSDYSTYHVVDYDTLTGAVKFQGTHQGYADDSCWSRGGAWALYGYTMAYRETQDIAFLKQAEKVADYIINIAKLPSDSVPVWDFDLKDKTNEPKDASAAAIMSSALFELGTLTENKDSGRTYLKVANAILKSLSSDNYFNGKGENEGFLLKHSTGAKPSNSEVDVPLIYADYYYLEALDRKLRIKKQLN